MHPSLLLLTLRPGINLENAHWVKASYQISGRRGRGTQSLSPPLEAGGLLGETDTYINNYETRQVVISAV
jgi:hypothetical protein